MKLTLKNVVENLYKKTGINVDVYDMNGDRVASCGNLKKYIHCNYVLSDFVDGIYPDKFSEVTYFKISGGYTTYIGVVEGVGSVAKNYAYMMSTLIENAVLRSDVKLSRSDSFKEILLNEATKEQIENMYTKYSVPNKPCQVLTIHIQPERQGEVMNLINQFSENLDELVVIDEHVLAYIKFYEADEDYQSVADFASSLFATLGSEIGVKALIGVGSSVVNLMDVAKSYEEAFSAVRMSLLSGFTAGVYTYKEYILLKMLEDMPTTKLKNYFDSLVDSSANEILSDPAVVETGEEFLATSLNISETSKNLYMHRNTLIYRLDKIEKATGLNIRKFSDAVTFKILVMIHRLLKK